MTRPPLQAHGGLWRVSLSFLPLVPAVFPIAASARFTACVDCAQRLALTWEDKQSQISRRVIRIERPKLVSTALDEEVRSNASLTPAVHGAVLSWARAQGGTHESRARHVPLTATHCAFQAETEIPSQPPTPPQIANNHDYSMNAPGLFNLVAFLRHQRLRNPA